MDRRGFLSAAGAGASTLLTGCVTTQGDNPLTQISGSGVLQGLGSLLQTGPSSSARNRLGPEANREAYSAYSAIFTEMRNSPDPLFVRLPGMAQAADARVSAANQFLDSLPETLSDLQLAQTWRQMEPFIASLNRPRSQARGLQPQPAGARRNPAARFQQYQGVSRITLQPGQTMTAVMRGHCADKTLPAFYTGLPLTMRPAEAFVAGDRWGRMQLALLDYFAANPNTVRFSDQQFMLWGLQGKDVNGSPYYFQALMQRPDLLDVLNRAVPGALGEIQRAQAMDEFNRHLQQMLQRNLPPEVRQLMGNASIIQALANPAEAPRLIEAELERMEQMSRNNPQQQPGPDAAFSTLAPRVFAHSEGVGRLGARVTMTNFSDQPFEFQPSRWVAETRTNHQRGMFTNAETVRVWDHVADGAESIDTFQSALSLSQRIGQFSLGGAGLRPGNPVFDRFSRSVQRLHRSQFAGLLTNPAARQLLPYIPILGNIKSAFDVFDTSLSAPERVLAAIGTIPGAGNLARLSVNGGRGVANVARWAIDNRGANFLANASQRTEFMREIADVGRIELGDGRELWQASFDTLRTLVPRDLQAG